MFSRLRDFLTLFRLAYFLRTNRLGGGANLPPSRKSSSGCLSPILFYTVHYTCIRSSYLKGFFPSFKTLDLGFEESMKDISIICIEKRLNKDKRSRRGFFSFKRHFFLICYSFSRTQFCMKSNSVKFPWPK